MAIEATLASFRDAVVYGKTDQLSARLQTDGALNADERIAVYRNNRQQALLATMGKHYPVARQVIGDDCFDQLCMRYNLIHPAVHYDLDAYGAHFADFLETIDAVGVQTPYLADLCRLEFALVKSYYARDRRTVDEQALAAVPAERQGLVVFELAADVMPLSLRHDVYQLWRQHHMAHCEPAFRCPEVETNLVIAREGFKPKVYSVNYSEVLLLQAIREQNTLGRLTSFPEFGESTLILMLSKGWVDGFHVAA